MYYFFSENTGGSGSSEPKSRWLRQYGKCIMSPNLKSWGDSSSTLSRSTAAPAWGQRPSRFKLATRSEGRPTPNTREEKALTPLGLGQSRMPMIGSEQRCSILAAARVTGRVKNKIQNPNKGTLANLMVRALSLLRQSPPALQSSFWTKSPLTKQQNKKLRCRHLPRPVNSIPEGGTWTQIFVSSWGNSKGQPGPNTTQSAPPTPSPSPR